MGTILYQLSLGEMALKCVINLMMLNVPEEVINHMHQSYLLRLGSYYNLTWIHVTQDKSTWSKTFMHLFPWSCVKKKSMLPTGRKWNEVVRKWMLIFVFLSLVSCHLDFLTIVSVLHILLLQLALSAEGEKRVVWAKKQGGKIVEHTHDLMPL